MLTRLWSFLTGYVSLVVEGKSLEKLINMAVSRGLYLWDVKWLDSGKVLVKVRINGVKALRHMARRTSSRFSIAAKGGLPFHIARVKKKKLLLAGAVFSVILVYLMSSFIWFVEVTGNKNIKAERIIKTAEEAGLSMGSPKMNMDKDEIERYLRNEIPEVSWVGIRITGTKAVIEIAEKIIIPPVDNSPANLVAKKAGLISEILVFSGKPVVNEGDMVRDGDILITGIIMPETQETQPPGEGTLERTERQPPIQYVRAKGIVRAKTWYEGYGESRIIDEGTRRTGKMAQILSIKLFGRELIVKGPKSPPFRDFVTSAKVKKLPEWRNISIPVEVITTNYYEVEKYRDIIGVSDAKSAALRKAVADVKSKIPEDARIVREITEEIRARGSNVIRIKAIVEVVEDIGRAEPLK